MLCLRPLAHRNYGGFSQVRLRTRLLTASVSLTLTAGSLVTMVRPVAAASNTYVIGVDNASPAGHNYMYRDYFPRSGTNILSGDVIDFKWNSGSLDGFHTATLLKTGDSATTVWSNTPIVIADSDDAAGTMQENPAAVSPTFPPAGSGAPSACGDATTPCTYNGTAQLNSGANPTAAGADFFVKVSVEAGTAVTFICLVHPGMQASLNVVSTGASPTDQSAASASQKAADDSEAAASAAAVSNPAPTTNSNGSKTWSVTLGSESQHTNVLEMLPASINIKAGDSVKYTTVSHEIHTATFPVGNDPSTDFTAFKCEGSGTTDTDATGPPTSCAGGPSNFEGHFLAAPVGGTVISSPSTLATSGILAFGGPFPTSYTFSFPNAGTFTYQCRVHDHMTGQVLAAAVAASLAATGGGAPASAPRPVIPEPVRVPAILFLMAAVAALVAVPVARRLRS